MEKLFEGESKAMEILWDNGPLPAREIALQAQARVGWNKNTTYTVLKKLEAKGFIRRDEPNFICTPLISRGEAQAHEAKSLLKRVFGGSKKALFSALLQDEKLSPEEIKELKELIEES